LCCVALTTNPAFAVAYKDATAASGVWDLTKYILYKHYSNVRLPTQPGTEERELTSLVQILREQVFIAYADVATIHLGKLVSMPPEDQQRLFDMFAKVFNRLKTVLGHDDIKLFPGETFVEREEAQACQHRGGILELIGPFFGDAMIQTRYMGAISLQGAATACVEQQPWDEYTFNLLKELTNRVEPSGGRYVSAGYQRLLNRFGAVPRSSK